MAVYIGFEKVELFQIPMLLIPFVNFYRVASAALTD
jgi:hypothetical protein